MRKKIIDRGDHQITALNRLKHSERGVFVPLLAVVLLGLIYVIVALGFDASMVKRSQMALRMKMDILCSAIGRTPATYRENAQVFRDFIQKIVDDKHLKFSRLEKATLVIPTMPDAGDFRFYRPPTDPTVVDSPVPFAGLGIPACDLCSGAASCFLPTAADRDCLFMGSTPGWYPENIMNDLQNAGNSVACEAEARVNTFLLGKVSFGTATPDANLVRVRSVYWSPVSGPNLFVDPLGVAPPEFYDVFNPPTALTDAIRVSPGLTIGIGTELFTSSWDARFRFKDASDLLGTPLENYDPMVKFANTASAFEAFANDQPEVPNYTVNTVTYGKLEGVTKPADDKYIGLINRGPSSGTPLDANYSIDPANQVTEFSSTNAVRVPSDREALLVSCLNPLTLARNIFLSTIVELAARHGQLRNMTEIVHINPIHRDERFFPGGGIEGDVTLPNSPALITSFGQDIAQRQFSIPYVFYHSGMELTERPNPRVAGGFNWPHPSTGPFAPLGIDFFTYTKQGWINPFETVATAGVPNSDVNWRPHHALIAQQLRHCFHLYGSGDYFSRYQAFFENIFDGQDFEPDVLDITDPPRTFYTPPYSAATHYWDPTPVGNGLSAGEAMSVLGTTQMCPYTENNLNLFKSYTGAGDTIDYNMELNQRFAISAYPCPLTSVGGIGNFNSAQAAVGNLTEGNMYGMESLELRPDLFGFIRYVQGPFSKAATPLSSPPGPAPGTIVPAIRSPGLFPIQNITIAPTQLPFQADGTTGINSTFYHVTQNQMSHILLVFHEQISDRNFDGTPGGEIAAIKAEVQHMRNSNPQMRRPITVVYFPSTFRDSSSVSRIYDAFDAPWTAPTNIDPPTIDNTSETVVYLISPYDGYFGDGIHPTGVAGKCRPDPAPPGWDARPEWQRFRDYWHCLLTDDTENIVRMATDIFYNRIMKSELRF